MRTSYFYLIDTPVMLPWWLSDRYLPELDAIRVRTIEESRGSLPTAATITAIYNVLGLVFPHEGRYHRNFYGLRYMLFTDDPIQTAPENVSLSFDFAAVEERVAAAVCSTLWGEPVLGTAASSFAQQQRQTYEQMRTSWQNYVHRATTNSYTDVGSWNTNSATTWTITAGASSGISGYSS